MRAKEGPRERLHAGTGPPGGAEHSGQSGEGSTSSPWPVRPASCLAPTCLALLGLGRSPDSLFPGLGWEPQGLHLQLRGQGPLRRVPTRTSFSSEGGSVAAGALLPERSASEPSSTSPAGGTLFSTLLRLEGCSADHQGKGWLGNGLLALS